MKHENHKEMPMKKMAVMGDGMAKHTPPPGMKESKEMPMHDPEKDPMISRCMEECGMGGEMKGEK